MVHDCYRERKFSLPDAVADNAAIEGPYISYKGEYFYLFVSFDYCSRGVNSNYKMMVGRSGEVMGPCVDKKGMAMTRGGDALLLAVDSDWPGVGRNAVLQDKGKYYLVFHGYDAHDHGRPKLRMLPMEWNNED